MDKPKPDKKICPLLKRCCFEEGCAWFVQVAEMTSDGVQYENACAVAIMTTTGIDLNVSFEDEG